MRDTIMAAIMQKDYDLKEMLGKIDRFYVAGKISETEYDELCEAARTTAKEAAGVDAKQEIELLWAAVHALEQTVAALQSGNTGGGTGETGETTVPDWHQPTGAHDAYNTGDLMRWTDGKVYRCTMNGCVWAPDVYPAAWEAVE